MASPDDMVEAFKAAVPFALREMAGVEAVCRHVGPAARVDGFAGLSAVVRLTTPSGEWQVMLNFPEGTAAELARRVLAGAAAEVPTDLVQDCMGEIANVVAGQAKTLLVGSAFHFTLSTPTVRSGGPAETAGGRVIRFESEAGPFTICLSRPAGEG